VLPWADQKLHRAKFASVRGSRSTGQVGWVRGPEFACCGHFDGAGVELEMLLEKLTMPSGRVLRRRNANCVA
jgi:hypothetical protein